MAKSAENRMRSNLELLLVIPDISRLKKYRHYFDALNERENDRLLDLLYNLEVLTLFNLIIIFVNKNNA
jgi:hypothetical protein